MLTSHELMGFMSAPLAAEILNYAYENDKPLYRTVLSAVAEARKLRPVFLERQPRAQRHATMAAVLSKPALEMVTGNLIRTWLLKKHQAMLVDFLNELGIAHKEGIVDDLPKEMDEAHLRKGVEKILANHPPEVVSVYLHAFNEMNEVEWPKLREMLDSDSRLQFGG